INVTMNSTGTDLETVIVTALGISRDKKSLGYAVTEVNQSEISGRSEGDIARVLNGKASGVQITQQSGMSGSGTNMLIRGMNSFTGSNQPLFIVDGVPFSSDTNEQGNFVNGNNGSSRFLDLDPNNIESMSILKGLAAATLYGSDGRNGVVLITTKGGASNKIGSKKTEISFSSSVFFNKIGSLPNYQNEYGGGFDQSFGWFFSNWGPAFSDTGAASHLNDTSGYFIEPGVLSHPYSTASPTTGTPQAFPEFAGQGYDYKPYDGVKDFFRTGIVLSNNVNARGSSENGKVSYNANFGLLDDQGFTPGNKLSRKTFSLGGNAKLSNKFTIGGTMNYANTDFVTPPVSAGYGSNVDSDATNASVFANLFYTPRSVDLMNLPYQNPITGESVYYRQNNSIQHPLWTVHNAQNSQNTNRVFGGVSLTYALTDDLNISYRYGLDMYSENNVNYSNKGGKTASEDTQSGIYQTWNNTNKITDHNIMVNGSHKFNDDIDIKYTVGATAKNEVFDQNGTSSVGQHVFNVLRHSNFANQKGIQHFNERNIIGLFAQTDFGYKNYLYLTLAARKDWVSNLASANRSITYPSASLSFIPTKFWKNDYVNYLKFRMGYGTSANFAPGYPTASYITLDAQYHQNGDGVDVVTNSVGNTLGNPDLKPELIGELEFGIEARFLKNRMSIDASIYKRSTNDLIINRPLDPSTGYTNMQTNIGLITNNGVEIDLNADVFKDTKIKWNTNINWSKSNAIVKDLGDTEMIVYSGFSSKGNAAIEGEPLTTMVGSTIKRDNDGNFVINSDGSYETDNDTKIIGDANPDFKMNFSNVISYKNFSLNFLTSWTQGGDMYSTTVATLLGRGVVNDDNFDRNNTFILPGVNAAGETNQVQINNSKYYFNNVLYGPDETKVYDATVFRLQEVSLSYRLAGKLIQKLPFGSIEFTLSGNNLWFYTPYIPKNTNFDPNVAGLGVGNGSGFEYINGPSSKRYGFSIKATF
ncbi:MAG TPA: SusC/RagA family TonB-linked outer membrane protein, partial [Crocinitomix sp.]|nr:SusC/RagA family TonB-linked outer membrane protein [Crocinitomix sp.]